MIKPEMAPTVKVPAELAGGGGKAHRSGMSKSASPGLPTDPACPQPPVQPPARGSRALTQQGSPVVATPPPPPSSGQRKPRGENKGCNFTPAERKCVFLQLTIRARSSPCRERCQAGCAARDKPLVPSSPGEGEGDGQRTCIPGPFPHEKPREGRGRNPLPVPTAFLAVGGRGGEGITQVSAELPAGTSPLGAQKFRAEAGVGLRSPAGRSLEPPFLVRSPLFPLLASLFILLVRPRF